MPIYEYKCERCGIFEEIVGFDEVVEECPTCGKKIKKVVSLNSEAEVHYNAKEHYEKVIKPEAKRIANNIKNGDEDTAANILGEDYIR